MNILPVDQMPLHRDAWGSHKDITLALLQFRERYGMDPEQVYFDQRINAHYLMLPVDWRERQREAGLEVVK
jgi:hypothetical protein